MPNTPVLTVDLLVAQMLRQWERQADDLEEVVRNNPTVVVQHVYAILLHQAHDARASFPNAYARLYQHQARAVVQRLREHFDIQ